MGAARVTARVVLDTNTLVSALVFQHGKLGWLRGAWQCGRLTPVICRATIEALIRVLAYPKFRLERWEIDALLADFLLYAESVTLPPGKRDLPLCRDAADQVFVDLLVTSGADVLVTGDKDLLDLAIGTNLAIQTPADFRERLPAPS